MRLPNHSAFLGLIAAGAVTVTSPCSADITYSGNIRYGHATDGDKSVVGGQARHGRAGHDDPHHLEHRLQMTPKHGRYGYRDRGGYDRNDRDAVIGRRHRGRRYGGGYDSYTDYGYRYNPYAGPGYGYRYKPYAGSGYGYRYNPNAGSRGSYGAGSAYGRSYPSVPKPVPHYRYRR